MKIGKFLLCILVIPAIPALFMACGTMNSNKASSGDLPGGQRSIFTGETSSFAPFYHEGYIYLTTGNSSRGRIIRFRPGDTEVETLMNVHDIVLAIIDGWIYCYHDGEPEIYKVRLDGSDKTRLTLDGSPAATIYNNTIFYMSSGEHYRELWKMNLDGSENVKFVEKKYNPFLIRKDILYALDHDTHKLDKLDLSGNLLASFSPDIFSFTVVDNTIYYITKIERELALCMMKTNGKGEKILDTGGEFINPCYYDGKIYYNTGKYFWSNGERSDYGDVFYLDISKKEAETLGTGLTANRLEEITGGVMLFTSVKGGTNIMDLYQMDLKSGEVKPVDFRKQ